MFKKFSEGILLQYLKNNGADDIKHIKSGSLLDHLKRVKGLLEDWDVSEEVCLAGLCHSVFSTEFFTKELLSKEKEGELEILVGERSMELIRHFSMMDRSTLKYMKREGKGTYKKRNTGDVVYITEQDVSDILSILIANEIDHIHGGNFHEIESSLRTYQDMFHLLPKNVLLVVNSYVKTIKKQNTEEFVSYISHATVWCKTAATSLIIDPWFFSSTVQSPVIQGLRPNQKTIDYIIPKPVNSIDEISPNIILLSHFHTHHSPLKEIAHFAKSSAITIICPPLESAELRQIEVTIGENVFSNITFTFVENDTEIKFAGFSIRAFTHTRKHHLGYHVSAPSFSFIHLSDSLAGTDERLLTLDPLWDKLGTYPATDHLFISAANHSQLMMKGHERKIVEHTSLSPVQATYLTKIINPKKVSLIGMSNFSIWDSGVEYTESPESVFNYFSWAMRFLLPSVEVVHLNPGDTFTHEDY